MKRVIVNYNKLTQEILNLLVAKYPDGYSDADIITFRNLSGELIEAVEVNTEDTIYLVKVSVKLVKSMESFADLPPVPEAKGIDFSKETNEEFKMVPGPDPESLNKDNKEELDEGNDN